MALTWKKVTNRVPMKWRSSLLSYTCLGLAASLLSIFTPVFSHQAILASEADESPSPIPISATTASSVQEGFPSEGAVDGDRFSVELGQLWKAASCDDGCYWEADLGEEVQIGSLLQILGDKETELSSSSLSYVWQIRADEQSAWQDLPTTNVSGERRLFRIHRLPESVKARYLRLFVKETGGTPPALREVEVYSDPHAQICFPEWFFVASSEEHGRISTCHQFLDLARRCEGRENIIAQYIWHGFVDESVALAEPRPLCVFYTGSFADWCEVDRSTWKGTQELLENSSLPMWGACGGGQVFGILSDTGYDSPWDCPKCRNPDAPKLPIYGHIGLKDPTVTTKCGDYSNNVYEIGPTPVRMVREDPVFAGVPLEFLVPEYHCGQLEYVPDGWELIVTKGEGGKSRIQCIRKLDTCIYAAQFHIELDGTPEISELIMTNFLNYAHKWNSSRREVEHASDSSPVRRPPIE